MGLKELKSNLDIAGGFGGAPNQTSTQQSTIPGPSVNNAIPDPDYHTKKGTTDSPFHSRGEGSGDHLIDLLEDRIVHSSNTTNIYDPQQMTGLSPGPPTPGGDQDFDGLDQGVIGGPRLFHGINNPQRGQGIQLGGVDLHEHLLTDTYVYNHGGSTEVVGPSPGETNNSDFQDLDGLDVGQPGGPRQFDLGQPSQVHADPTQTTPTELVNDYTSTVHPNANHGNSSWPVVPAVPGGNNQNSPFQDLDGVPGPQFDFSSNGGSSTLHTDLLLNIYTSTVNPGSSYGAGQPGGTYPDISPSPLASTPFQDLDGITPGGYINNLPT